MPLGLNSSAATLLARPRLPKDAESDACRRDGESANALVSLERTVVRTIDLLSGEMATRSASGASLTRDTPALECPDQLSGRARVGASPDGEAPAPPEAAAEAPVGNSTRGERGAVAAAPPRGDADADTVPPLLSSGKGTFRECDRDTAGE